MTKITIIQWDITKQDTDVIVNAANARLMGWWWVDWAIHKAGWPAILEACKEIKQTMQSDFLPTGEAVITTWWKMPTKYVIHTVWPIYTNYTDNKWMDKLASCYTNSLQLAIDNGCKSISFPSISTGAYMCPIEICNKIALETVSKFVQERPGIDEVRFVLFSDKDCKIYKQTYQTIKHPYKLLSYANVVFDRTGKQIVLWQKTLNEKTINNVIKEKRLTAHDYDWLRLLYAMFRLIDKNNNEIDFSSKSESIFELKLQKNQEKFVKYYYEFNSVFNFLPTKETSKSAWIDELINQKSYMQKLIEKFELDIIITSKEYQKKQWKERIYIISSTWKKDHNRLTPEELRNKVLNWGKEK